MFRCRRTSYTRHCAATRAKGVAEKSGSRTHQGRLTPLSGFEVRAPHRGASLFRVSRTHIRVRALTPNDVRVADAPRQFYAIEVFEHLDGEVAPDAGAVAECGGGQRLLSRARSSAIAWRFFRDDGQEKAVLRYAHHEALPLGAREHGLHLSRIDARGGRELGERRRPQPGKPRLELLPQREIGAARAPRGASQAAHRAVRARRVRRALARPRAARPIPGKCPSRGALRAGPENRVSGRASRQASRARVRAAPSSGHPKSASRSRPADCGWRRSARGPRRWETAPAAIRARPRGRGSPIAREVGEPLGLRAAARRRKHIDHRAAAQRAARGSIAQDEARRRAPLRPAARGRAARGRCRREAATRPSTSAAPRCAWTGVQCFSGSISCRGGHRSDAPPAAQRRARSSRRARRAPWRRGRRG